ncbi:unnamed protein product, partial [Timema podura]|nr:unnamed protein product [Timema podura]
MEHLLDRLVALEEYMQQGIPVVSRFLVDYLALWDGLSFRQQVYNLLSWITFYSFEELHDCILVHLQVLFVSSDEIVKCQIISCLKRMIANLFLVVHRRVNNIDSPFLQCTNNWDITTTLESLTEFVEQLVVLGLRLERRSYLVLSEALDFYETVSGYFNTVVCRL